MSHWRSVAYVESPLQLMSVIEAHAYGILGTNTALVVRDPNGTIARTLDALKVLGLPAGVKLFSTKDTPYSTGYTPPKSDYTHVLGDPFSGQQQSGLLRRTRTQDIVLVDDGLNTYAVIEALAANKSLTRPGHNVSSARKALGLATTHLLRKAAFAGRLTIFTAMPATTRLLQEVSVLDARLISHDFNWLRSKPENPTDASHTITEKTVIVGSGFVPDGLIHQADYLDWISLTSAGTPTRYLPHRRMSPSVLKKIAAIPGVRVATNTAAVELELRSLTSQHHVHFLPTTALVTLTPMLVSNSVSIMPHSVPDSWWTETTLPAQREYLSRPLQLFESM